MTEDEAEPGTKLFVLVVSLNTEQSFYAILDKLDRQARPEWNELAEDRQG